MNDRRQLERRFQMRRWHVLICRRVRRRQHRSRLIVGEAEIEQQHESEQDAQE
jgi:hypothetical protein